LRRVARIVRLTLDRLEGALRPGITTGELDRIAADVVAAHRARSAPVLEDGFPITVLVNRRWSSRASGPSC
jgi:methionyl aminopeptidase